MQLTIGGHMKQIRLLEQIDCRYLITENGKVFSLFGSRGLRKTPKKLKTQIDSKGYVRVTVFFDNNRRFCTRVHRLVASAFNDLDLFDKNSSVHHKDENKKNNHFTNLKILTYKIHSRISLEKARKKEVHSFTSKEKKEFIKSGFDEYLKRYQEILND